MLFFCYNLGALLTPVFPFDVTNRIKIFRISKLGATNESFQNVPTMQVLHHYGILLSRYRGPFWNFFPFFPLFPLMTYCCQDIGDHFGTFSPFSPFSPLWRHKYDENFWNLRNHLVVPQCIYHVNFTSPWPFVLKIPSLSDSEHRPVHLRGLPVWRHSWNTKSLITFERFKQLTWFCFWNSSFPNGYHIKRQKTQLFSDDSSPNSFFFLCILSYLD